MTTWVCRSFLLLILIFLSCSHRSFAADTASARFRLVTYDVWYGFTQVSDREPAYLEWMKDQVRDIVAMQELNGATIYRFVGTCPFCGCQSLYQR